MGLNRRFILILVYTEALSQLQHVCKRGKSMLWLAIFSSAKLTKSKLADTVRDSGNKKRCRWALMTGV